MSNTKYDMPFKYGTIGFDTEITTPDGYTLPTSEELNDFNVEAKRLLNEFKTLLTTRIDRLVETEQLKLGKSELVLTKADTSDNGEGTVLAAGITCTLNASGSDKAIRLIRSYMTCDFLDEVAANLKAMMSLHERDLAREDISIDQDSSV